MDLAKFGNGKENQVTLAELCHFLNERLSWISPLQVQLAAIRWTAKGNLIVTGGPTSSPQSLQAAALHISTIIPSLLSHLTNTHIPQPGLTSNGPKYLSMVFPLAHLRIGPPTPLMNVTQLWLP